MDQPLSPTHYGDIATQYARDVVDGRIIACKWHRLACQRHLSDLTRADLSDWPYTYNPPLTDHDGIAYRPAERVCKFIQLLPHVKGDWARGSNPHIVLEPVQIFILASIFGWINRHTQRRRFIDADVFIPRKNAKSTLAAGIGLYMLTLDGEFGAEVYSGATSEDQAHEVFRPALLMARATPRFCLRFGVTPNASNISVVGTHSKFEPLIGKPGDGASPHCTIVDEYHEHKTPDLYETMRGGTGARSQPLTLVITTAGSDISGPCYAHQDELQKILEGLIQDDRRFGIIFTIDNPDDWHTDAALHMANPMLGVSVNIDLLRAEQLAALRDPRKQNAFKTKKLNIWVGARSPWLNLHNAKLAGDPTLTLESFRGQPCKVGLDLASKQDIASCVYEFTAPGDDGKPHYYAISRNYVPQDRADLEENAHYRAWIAEGHLIATPGNMIDLQRMQDDLLAASEIVVISEIAKDQYGGQQMGPNLQREGFQVIDVPQRVSHLSEPMKDIQALIDAGRFHHDGNPAYLWMLGNVEVRPDANDNQFPRKARDANKIDGAVATIIAHGRHICAPIDAAPTQSIYDQGVTI